MGLDVEAVSHLRYVRPIPSDTVLERLRAELAGEDKEMDDVYFLIHPNEASFRRQLVGTKSGLYQFTPASRQHNFRVGPYSYYDWWREQLRRFALGVTPATVWKNPRRFKGKPFVQLIDFSDVGGRIGAQVASALAEDFRSYRGRAKRFADSLEDGDDWLEVYGDFARGMRLAAQDGILEFG